MKILGIIGYPLSHSFSKKYFDNRFRLEINSNYEFRNFEIESLLEIRSIVERLTDLIGLSVTIPYKECILSYLDEINPDAKVIGAVNCIKISRENEKIHLKGYNTDTHGFKESVQPLLKYHHNKALILGTGGASKAIAFTLNKLGIEYRSVSRKTKNRIHLNYAQLNEEIIDEYPLIINTTPLGMYPEIESYPDIPYQFLSSKHLLYDLTYNPFETLFLQKGKENGASVKNGLDMLHLQANKAFEIWTE